MENHRPSNENAPMTEDWLYELDDVGESPFSRLRKATQSSISILLATLLDGLSEAELAEEPPIHRAARWGEVRKVRELIETGADFDILNGHGLAPIHWAALNGSADLAKLLINRGAFINARDNIMTGLTPLGLAKIMGYRDIVDLFSKAGGVS